MAPYQRCLLGIFVGGRSSRMAGFPKGLLQHPRQPTHTLVEHWVAAARALKLPCVLVGRHSAYAALQLTALDDRPTGAGPIGGLHALLEYGFSRGQRAIAVACDMPHVTGELLSRLASHGTDAPILAPRRRSPERWEPLLARYDPAQVLPLLRKQLSGPQRSLQHLLASAPTCELPLSPQEWLQLHDWDTPADARVHGQHRALEIHLAALDHVAAPAESIAAKPLRDIP